jgi:hypothetical protein
MAIELPRVGPSAVGSGSERRPVEGMDVTVSRNSIITKVAIGCGIALIAAAIAFFIVQDIPLHVAIAVPCSIAGAGLGLSIGSLIYNKIKEQTAKLVKVELSASELRRTDDLKPEGGKIIPDAVEVIMIETPVAEVGNIFRGRKATAKLQEMFDSAIDGFEETGKFIAERVIPQNIESLIVKKEEDGSESFAITLAKPVEGDIDESIWGVAKGAKFYAEKVITGKVDAKKKTISFDEGCIVLENRNFKVDIPVPIPFTGGTFTHTHGLEYIKAGLEKIFVRKEKGKNQLVFKIEIDSSVSKLGKVASIAEAAGLKVDEGVFEKEHGRGAFLDMGFITALEDIQWQVEDPADAVAEVPAAVVDAPAARGEDEAEEDVESIDGDVAVTTAVIVDDEPSADSVAE